MSNILKELQERGLVPGCPPWLPLNTMYLTIVGSHSYGVADTSVKDKVPDYDVYGWCVPPKTLLFSHLAGHIQGFGNPPPSFEQWQKHHIMDQDLAGLGKEWDFQIFSIVTFFELCRQNNPNMIDSLFTPENCVIHCTEIGRMVRDSRKLFLSKEAWKKFRGYASSQMKKIISKKFDGAEVLAEIIKFEDEHGLSHKTTLTEIEAETEKRKIGNPDVFGPFKMLSDRQLAYYARMYEEGNSLSTRFEIHKFHGFDLKFAYHVLRLYDEAEQILLEGEIDLQRAKEPMKAIRRGEWTIDEIQRWMIEKDKALEVAYVSCKLPEHAPIEPLRQLMFNCLEQHYGSLENCVQQEGWAEQNLREIDTLLNKCRTKLYN